MKKLFKCLLWIFLGFPLIDDMVSGAQENLALGQTSIQSTLYVDWYSEYAVDGVYDSCSHTQPQTDPWLRVDLLTKYRVGRVAITNRQGYYYFRLNGAVIRIGNFPQDVYSNPICAEISSIPSGATANFSCGGLEGRYVIIHNPGDQKILCLCEVEVYRYLGGNVALAGAASQSSTLESWSPEKAIDGNLGLRQINTTCSSTLIETNPWLRLDLRHIYKVIAVAVTNRRDCCAEQIIGAEIHIGNSLVNNGNNNPICAVIFSIPAGQSINYTCNGMEGRYVNLIIPGQVKTLTLCEVEVYGEGPALRRSFVKMQFNSRADLTKNSMREHLLNQLGSVLADRGITDVTLRWSQNPQQEVMQKLDSVIGRCGNGK